MSDAVSSCASSQSATCAPWPPSRSHDSCVVAGTGQPTLSSHSRVRAASVAKAATSRANVSCRPAREAASSTASHDTFDHRLAPWRTTWLTWLASVGRRPGLVRNGKTTSSTPTSATSPGTFVGCASHRRHMAPHACCARCRPPGHPGRLRTSHGTLPDPDGPPPQRRDGSGDRPRRERPTAAGRPRRRPSGATSSPRASRRAASAGSRSAEAPAAAAGTDPRS